MSQELDEYIIKTDDCAHGAITAFTTEDGSARLWACASCRRRFYPACPTCVDVGHRGEVHVDGGEYVTPATTTIIIRESPASGGTVIKSR